MIAHAKRQFNAQLIQSSIPNQCLLWKNINSSLHCKHTTSLPSSTHKTSLAECFALFYSNAVSTLCLKLSCNPSTMPPHSNPLLLLKYYHNFLVHLLMKSLNSCMPLLINLDPIPTFLLTQVSATKQSLVTPLLKNHPSIKIY